MLAACLTLVFLCIGVTPGIGWLTVRRVQLPPLEKLVASFAMGFVAVWGWAWLVYIFALPQALLWLLPATGAAGLWLGRSEGGALLRTVEVRHALCGQSLVTVWCIGWMATVVSYSGGGWAGDWFEHWERTRFFLERWPLDRMFLGIYGLPARPPLANVQTAAFLALSCADFTFYQFVSTVLASLAFLPAAALAYRWGSTKAVVVVTVLFMVNPLFVQNATFPWTKLPAAFFVLAGLLFFLRAQDSATPPGPALLCALCLGAGLLAHYSAGPYIVLLAAAWLLLGRRRWKEKSWWRMTMLAAGVGALVLASWFAWSLAHYGWRGTLLSNTSATASLEGNQLVKIGLNLFDTVVPPSIRSLDTWLIDQGSPWGWWRDWFFQHYQINLIFAFGSIMWLIVGREAFLAARAAGAESRRFWIAFSVGAIVLGTAAHGARDHWGLAHICLQPLVLIGLAFMASRWTTFRAGTKRLLLAGGAIDVTLGIALHFAVQNFAFDRWLAPNGEFAAQFNHYSATVLMNLRGKVHNHLEFFSDRAPIPFTLLLAGLALVLLAALNHARTGKQPLTNRDHESILTPR